MSSASKWQSLCRVEDLPEGCVRGFALPEAPRVEVIVMRDGDALRAYRNRCPHRGTPLNLTPDHFLDATGDFMVCSTHGALFRLEDGYCVAGPCQGDTLSSLETRIADGVVEITGI